MAISFHSRQIYEFYTGKFYNHKIFIYTLPKKSFVEIKFYRDLLFNICRRQWPGSPKESPWAAYAASAAIVRTPMLVDLVWRPP
jgi:hypothetical protein